MTPELRVERTGTRQGVASNGRGAALRFGPADHPDAEGTFTPGELLALALAACNLMSSDLALTRRLGGGVPPQVVGTVQTVKDPAQNAYVDARVELAVDGEGAAALDTHAWDELVTVASRAAELGCTVGRTLEHGMTHTISIVRDADEKEEAT